MDWSTTEAATWWGISKRTWERYEAGATTIPPALIIRINDPEHDAKHLLDGVSA